MNRLPLILTGDFARGRQLQVQWKKSGDMITGCMIKVSLEDGMLVANCHSCIRQTGEGKKEKIGDHSFRVSFELIQIAGGPKEYSFYKADLPEGDRVMIWVSSEKVLNDDESNQEPIQLSFLPQPKPGASARLLRESLEVPEPAAAQAPAPA